MLKIFNVIFVITNCLLTVYCIKIKSTNKQLLGNCSFYKEIEKEQITLSKKLQELTNNKHFGSKNFTQFDEKISYMYKNKFHVVYSETQESKDKFLKCKLGFNGLFNELHEFLEYISKDMSSFFVKKINIKRKFANNLFINAEIYGTFIANNNL